MNHRDTCPPAEVVIFSGFSRGSCSLNSHVLKKACFSRTSWSSSASSLTVVKPHACRTQACRCAAVLASPSEPMCTRSSARIAQCAAWELYWSRARRVASTKTFEGVGANALGPDVHVLALSTPAVSVAAWAASMLGCTSRYKFDFQFPKKNQGKSTKTQPEYVLTAPFFSKCLTAGLCFGGVGCLYLTSKGRLQSGSVGYVPNNSRVRF